MPNDFKTEVDKDGWWHCKKVLAPLPGRMKEAANPHDLILNGFMIDRRPGHLSRSRPKACQRRYCPCASPPDRQPIRKKKRRC
jgi:hypothetical protein